MYAIRSYYATKLKAAKKACLYGVGTAIVNGTVPNNLILV